MMELLLLDRMFNLSAKPTSPNSLRPELKSTMLKDISAMFAMLAHHVEATKIPHRELASRRLFPLLLPKEEEVLNRGPILKTCFHLTSLWSEDSSSTESIGTG